MIKLMTTSSEDENERGLKDVFKTSSSRQMCIGKYAVLEGAIKL